MFKKDDFKLELLLWRQVPFNYIIFVEHKRSLGLGSLTFP